MESPFQSILTWILLLLVVPGLLVVRGGCNREEDRPLGEQLASTVLEEDPYLEWGQFPGSEGFIEAGFPHGPEVRVFINDVIEQSLDQPKEEFPYGSIILKENDDEGDIFGLGNTLDIMWKVQDYDPQHNDWFWVNMNRDGNINFQGSLQACTACHRQARDNDYIFLYPVSPEQ